MAGRGSWYLVGGAIDSVVVFGFRWAGGWSYRGRGGRNRELEARVCRVGESLELSSRLWWRRERGQSRHGPVLIALRFADVSQWGPTNQKRSPDGGGRVKIWRQLVFGSWGVQNK
jgi:hypothetical protein